MTKPDTRCLATAVHHERPTSVMMVGPYHETPQCDMRSTTRTTTTTITTLLLARNSLVPCASAPGLGESRSLTVGSRARAPPASTRAAPVGPAARNRHEGARRRAGNVSQPPPPGVYENRATIYRSTKKPNSTASYGLSPIQPYSIIVQCAAMKRQPIQVLTSSGGSPQNVVFL